MTAPPALRRGVLACIAVLGSALLVGCGSDGDSLLHAGDLGDVYDGASAGKYGIEGDRNARGTFKGKILYRGRKLVPRELISAGAISNDCRSVVSGAIMSEQFLVGPDGALKNALVWVEQGITGSFGDPPSTPVVLDQIACRYVPHVVVVQAGQELHVKSSDDFLHNVRFNGRNQSMNKPMPRPMTLDPLRWTKTDIGIEFACDVHSWMQAWVSVVPHKFWVLTGADGSFSLPLPPGTFKIQVWHEGCAPVEGQNFDVTIKPGETQNRDFTMELK